MLRCALVGACLAFFILALLPFDAPHAAAEDPPAASPSSAAVTSAEGEHAIVQSFAPGGRAKSLPIDSHPVIEWVLGPKRQRDRKPVLPAAIYDCGEMFFIADSASKRWLVGHIHDAASKTIECDQQFENLAALVTATRFPPLPPAPAGFVVREVCRLPKHATRMATCGDRSRLFILCGNGDVWQVVLDTGAHSILLRGSDYIDASRGERMCFGLAFDAARRLYVVVNQRIDSVRPVMNEVTIYRTPQPVDAAGPVAPKPWLKTAYPWGIGPFNHGVGHLALGPDGYLYVNSGSRSDGNERGGDERYSSEGETPLTACIWRLDPRVDSQPTIELYARGLRNAYAFAWNDQGEMYATENGPDADPPEEFNRIEAGKHYGFPYRFSNFDHKPYPHTPDAPAGMTFVDPLPNLGPDGKSGEGPISSFDPHSSPLGLSWLDTTFPAGYQGSFVCARFGNLVKNTKDVGFDLLQVEVKPAAPGGPAIACRRFVAGLARPVDVLAFDGQIFVAEYSRQLSNTGYGSMLPGRVLVIAAEGK